MTLHGVLPVFQTPFLDDESLDLATLRREIDWLYEQGADGIVFAMVSELLRLSDDERMRVTELACEHGLGRGAVVISVGAESSVQARRFAQHAESRGATALMAIPPVATALHDEQLYAYYARILESVSIPLIVQDASGYVGRPMSIGVQAKLFKDFRGVMFKPEAPPIGPRLSQLLEATDGQARVFEGTGGVALVDSYRRGIVGTMPGADLMAGIVALWRALQADDEPRIYQLSTLMTTLVAALAGLDMFLAAEKHLLCRQGVFTNTLVRGPMGATPDAAALAEVDRLFDRLMIAASTPSATASGGPA